VVMEKNFYFVRGKSVLNGVELASDILCVLIKKL
jgi:hypothetical protein